jgi:CheY-like chemotaxis protein
MGGEIHFRSIQGEGTTFEIRLFLSQIRQDIEVEPAVYRKRIGYHGQRRTVLVVDNEQVDRELVINILAPLGFNVVEAATGKECVELYPQVKPDVILMDLAMPMMDGWEASYIIRKVHHSEIPIAIVSANAYDKNLENAAGIESHDFMVKPVNVEDLLDWIGNRLALDWIVEKQDIKLPTTLMQTQTPPDDIHVPEQHHLQDILSLVNIGYVKGIQQKLDEIQQGNPQYQAFTLLMKQLVSQFKLEAVKKYIEDVKR